MALLRRLCNFDGLRCGYLGDWVASSSSGTGASGHDNGLPSDLEEGRSVTMLQTTLTFGLLGILVGCVSSPPPSNPTHEEIMQADLGPRISLEDAQSQAKVFLKRRFKDPDPTEIGWGSIHAGSWLRGEEKTEFGYMIPAAIISAHERYGGYYGFQFFFIQGTLKGVVAFLDPDSQDQHNYVAPRKKRIY